LFHVPPPIVSLPTHTNRNPQSSSISWREAEWLATASHFGARRQKNSSKLYVGYYDDGLPKSHTVSSGMVGGAFRMLFHRRDTSCPPMGTRTATPPTLARPLTSLILRHVSANLWVSSLPPLGKTTAPPRKDPFIPHSHKVKPRPSEPPLCSLYLAVVCLHQRRRITASGFDSFDR
jgi:hypothetical protein